jgi:hypothetical protein
MLREAAAAADAAAATSTPTPLKGMHSASSSGGSVTSARKHGAGVCARGASATPVSAMPRSPLNLAWASDSPLGTTSHEPVGLQQLLGEA